jgi:hypothetical protein
MDRIRNLPVLNRELTFILKGCGSTISPPYLTLIHNCFKSLTAKEWIMNVDIIWLVAASICLCHVAGSESFEEDEAKLWLMSLVHIYIFFNLVRLQKKY